MFNFFKRRKQNVFELDEEKLRKQKEELENERDMENDSVCQKNVEKSAAFFKANK